MSFWKERSTLSQAFMPTRQGASPSPETYRRDRADTASAKDGYHAVYARSDRDSALLVLEGRDEALKIFTTVRGSAEAEDQFTGERDGCD